MLSVSLGAMNMVTVEGKVEKRNCTKVGPCISILIMIKTRVEDISTQACRPTDEIRASSEK